MITILHVLAMSSFSGAENVVCQIISMFADDPDIRMVYCSPDGPIRKVLFEKNIEYEAMERFTIFELKKVIRRIQPDIIHAHDVRATVFASIVCGKIKLISHMHNNWEQLRKISIKGVLYELSVKKASTVVWVSQSSFNQYRYAQTLREKSIILNNIIDVKKTREIASESISEISFDIVSIGRMVYQKNPERLIGIIEKVAKKKKNIRACIIGDGELFNKVSQLIQRKSLETNIKLLGYMEKPLGILLHSRVFLMSSRWEGTPMSVLESLALGTPVVGTPVDGMLELVEDGLNGYLSDDDDVIADHIIDIVTNDALHNQLSDNAIKNSDERNSIIEYKEILEGVYRGRR